jgi:hypothetical protein
MSLEIFSTGNLFFTKTVVTLRSIWKENFSLLLIPNGRKTSKTKNDAYCSFNADFLTKIIDKKAIETV